MILIKNIFLNRFDSIIKLKITGRNINNYIKKLFKNKIKILDLKFVSYKEIVITVDYRDYLKILEYKTIYKVEVIERLGKLRLKDKISKNKILFMMFLIGIGLLFGLSRLIFDIEVIHAKKDIRDLVLSELSNYGISKYRLKKEYRVLEEIEDEILKNNKDTLEWIEILESGTKYTVRVQERVVDTEQEDVGYRDLVASKTAVLTTIIASKGEKVKEINTYVNKGDVVVSGSLVHSDGSVTYVAASGQILGSVWYTVEIEYPYIYREERLTGKQDTVYVLNFLGHKIDLFSKGNYKNFKSKDTNILNNYLIPISFFKQEREELDVVEAIYTYDEALNKALALAKEKLVKGNDKIKEVKSIKILDQYDTSDNTIKLKLFISVIEDITDTRVINIGESIE